MAKYRAIPEYYDAEFAHLDMLRRDVPFLLKLMGNRPQSVLELAAGTGRVAIPLAQAGHRVVGVDYDNRMLEIARKKRNAAGLGKKIEFTCGDCLNLRLKQKFDWVVCLFNTFLNFTKPQEQDGFLQSVKRHMKPGGCFYLDIFHPDLDMLAARATWGLDRVEFEALGRHIVRTTDTVETKQSLVQELTYRYLWKDERGKEREQANRFWLRSIFPRELELLLERNGLRVEKMWGDYDRSKVAAHSPRILTLCRHSTGG